MTMAGGGGGGGQERVRKVKSSFSNASGDEHHTAALITFHTGAIITTTGHFLKICLPCCRVVVVHLAVGEFFLSPWASSSSSSVASFCYGAVGLSSFQESATGRPIFLGRKRVVHLGKREGLSSRLRQETIRYISSACAPGLPSD